MQELGQESPLFCFKMRESSIAAILQDDRESFRRQQESKSLQLRMSGGLFLDCAFHFFLNVCCHFAYSFCVPLSLSFFFFLCFLFLF